MQYNHKNERTAKYVNGDFRLYMYDEASHLVGEYTVTGQPIVEYVWLGDTPIAALYPNNAVVYLLTDHQNKPRRGVDSVTKQVVWTWDPDAFGVFQPTLARVEVNLRFPGQYYDKHTGLYYNHNRYYNPQIGRYLEPDPIGLEGGLNPYAYAANNPVMAVDPSGLNPEYNFNLGMYLPALPQPAVDFSAGLGDSILFGYGENLRSQLNIDGGVNRNSASYSNGETASLLMGTAGTSRATYVLASKALSRSRNERVLTAGSNVRNFLKRWTGPALISKTEQAKIKPLAQHIAEKGFERAVSGLGRTREGYNKALIPLSLGQGARLNTLEHEHD